MSKRWEPSASGERAVTGVWPAQPLRPYTGPLYALSTEDLEFFKSRYELNTVPAMRGIMRGADDRYALPIFDARGIERGIVLRQPWGGAPIYGCSLIKPKADTYVSRRGPVQSHYGTQSAARHNALVVVEDQLSAIKLAAHGYPSVALLGTPADKIGTYSGSDRVAELSRRGAVLDEVIIALDSDATEDAFMFARKWGHAFRRLRVAILSSDIKDTPSSEFAEVLQA